MNTILSARKVKIVFALLGLLALGQLVQPPAPAQAHGDVPAHAMGRLECSPGRVVIKTPVRIDALYNVNHRSPEYVRWSPDLYRWNGSQYVLYSSAAPWFDAFTTRYYGFTNRGGTKVWGRVGNAAQAIGYPFNNLPSGIYTIKHFITWNTLSGQHAHWHHQYCQI